VVINDRWGKGIRHKHGGYYTTEYGAGLSGTDHPWEENRGMGHSFGYNRNEPLSNYKRTQELVLMLVDLVSRGGNLLLDIGPTADGRIPEIMQSRLVEIGEWLAVNGEAIYATRPHTVTRQWSAGVKPKQAYKQHMAKYNVMERVGKPKDGRAVIQAFFTKKPGVLYAITPGWPGKKLVLEKCAADAVAGVTLLGTDVTVPWKKNGANLVLDLAGITADQLPCLWAYTFKVAYKK
jgi:alpha-L-fucosidase